MLFLLCLSLCELRLEVLLKIVDMIVSFSVLLSGIESVIRVRIEVLNWWKSLILWRGIVINCNLKLRFIRVIKL